MKQLRITECIPNFISESPKCTVFIRRHYASIYFELSEVSKVIEGVDCTMRNYLLHSSDARRVFHILFGPTNPRSSRDASRGDDGSGNTENTNTISAVGRRLSTTESIPVRRDRRSRVRRNLRPRHNTEVTVRSYRITTTPRSSRNLVRADALVIIVTTATRAGRRDDRFVVVISIVSTARQTRRI